MRVIGGMRLSSRLSEVGLLCRQYSTATSGNRHDHYATLGLHRDATTKEIKAAFYKLSKKYHPDTNPDDPAKAADQFQKIAAAYEVLGTQDNRRAYDATLKPRFDGRGHPTGHHPGPTHASEPIHRQRQYTDIDIDYKDFAHFQRTNRRRKAYHDHWQMPDEFYTKFASEKKGHAGGYAMYSDSRAAQREAEERRLHEELEAMKYKQQHPLPTFEQLLQQQELSKKERNRKAMSVGFGVIAIAFIVTMASMFRR